MRRLLTAVLPLLLALAAAPAEAQWIPRIPLSLEVRGGGVVPLGDFADARPGVEAEAGPAFSAGAAFHFTESLALFAAYEWAGFGCSRCADAGLDDQLVDSGAAFGLEAIFPLGRIGPWVRAGGLYHELRFSGLGGELASEPALGFLVGAGATVGLPAGLRLTPGLFYRSYSAELDLGGLPGRTLDVNHLRAGVGLAYRF